MEESPEWGGHEAHALGHRRVAEIAEAEVDQVLDAGRLRPSPADVQHPGGGVDADDGDSGEGHRDCDAPGPDPELDDGAPRFACLGDVEVDVLGDGPAPGS